ncbi:Sialic acid synthase [Blattella germanica]|nr:Sialic acid synthase [Blattella germanica]
MFQYLDRAGSVVSVLASDPAGPGSNPGRESGADCVKFQKTCLQEKFNAAALQRPYIGPHSWGNTYGEHKQHLEFSLSEYQQLQEFASQIDIIFTASAMDTISLDVLDSLEVPFIKIGSGDANNFPLLRYAATKRRPLVVSTGRYFKFDTVINVICPTFLNNGKAQIKTKSMQDWRTVHVLERHITLNKSWKGSDHVCSLIPSEFQELVQQVRLVEAALGSPTKRFQLSEKACYDKLGKTLVASRNLNQGQLLKEEDIKVKVAEPKGCPAEKFHEVIGRRLARNVNADESIKVPDVI